MEGFPAMTQLNLPDQQSTFDETLLGAIDGTNRTFLILGPQPTGLDLWLNGLFLTLGLDYTLTGNTITLITPTAPQVTDILTSEVWTS